MQSTPNYYEVLKIAWDAPPELVQAAYRTLALKYHPDQNNAADAAHRMALINEAYEVLSDPIQRLKHDDWLAEIQSAKHPPNPSASRNAPDAKRQAKKSRPSPESPSRPPPAAPHRQTNTPQNSTGETQDPITQAVERHFAKFWALYLPLVPVIVIIALVCLAYFGSEKPTAKVVKSEDLPRVHSAGKWEKRSDPDPDFAAEVNDYFSQAAAVQADQKAKTKTPARKVYLRPVNAPNGMPWPSASGYVSGYQKMNEYGLSEVTIDNSRNNSDVFVKLFSRESELHTPIRHIFIRAGGQFTIREVSTGNYDVRYLDLDSGMRSKTEAFNLKQTKTYEGAEYRAIAPF